MELVFVDCRVDAENTFDFELSLVCFDVSVDEVQILREIIVEDEATDRGVQQLV